MPSQALGDPRREREANDAIPVPHGYLHTRCVVCHAPNAANVRGPRPKTCSARCRQFLWRRNGDPDGPLDWSRART